MVSILIKKLSLFQIPDICLLNQKLREKENSINRVAVTHLWWHPLPIFFYYFLKLFYLLTLTKVIFEYATILNVTRIFQYYQTPKTVLDKFLECIGEKHLCKHPRSSKLWEYHGNFILFEESLHIFVILFFCLKYLA